MQTRKTRKELILEAQARVDELKNDATRMHNYLTAVMSSSLPKERVLKRFTEIKALLKLIDKGIPKNRKKSYYEEQLELLKQFTLNFTNWQAELRQAPTTTSQQTIEDPYLPTTTSSQEPTVEPLLGNADAQHGIYNTLVYGFDSEVDKAFRQEFQFKSDLPDLIKMKYNQLKTGENLSFLNAAKVHYMNPSKIELVARSNTMVKYIDKAISALTQDLYIPQSRVDQDKLHDSLLLIEKVINELQKNSDIELKHTVLTKFNELVAKNTKESLVFYHNCIDQFPSMSDPRIDEFKNHFNQFLALLAEGVKEDGDINYYKSLLEDLLALEKSVETMNQLFSRPTSSVSQTQSTQIARKPNQSPTHFQMWDQTEKYKKRAHADKAQDTSPKKKLA